MTNYLNMYSDVASELLYCDVNWYWQAELYI